MVMEMSITTNQKEQTVCMLLLVMPQGRGSPQPPSDCFGTLCCYGNIEMRPYLALNKPPLVSIAMNIAKQQWRLIAGFGRRTRLEC